MYLNLVLGVPLTDFHCLPACIQVSGKCCAFIKSPLESRIGPLTLAYHLYRQIVMMSVEQITCVKL